MLETSTLPVDHQTTHHDGSTLADSPDRAAARVNGLGARIASLKKARREEATRRVALKIRQTEDKIDIAGISLAELLATSLQARMDAKISATFGDDLAISITEAICIWSKSRTQTVAAHKRALRYSGVLGTQTVAEGDTDRPQQP